MNRHIDPHQIGLKQNGNGKLSSHYNQAWEEQKLIERRVRDRERRKGVKWDRLRARRFKQERREQT